MRIPYTWDNIDQPDDQEIAGSPWFYTSTYREFHDGLIASSQELQKYSDLFTEFEIASSPYDEELGRLDFMIKWGKERLDRQKSAFDDITLSGVSYRYLRYLKAGILLRAKKLIDKPQSSHRKSAFPCCSPAGR